MKIFYVTSNYISYTKAGIEYMSCLKLLGHDLVERPQDADVCVIHSEPGHMRNHLKQVPGLADKPLAGYFVWELERMPHAFEAGVDMVDAVWTCSAFSAAAFAAYARPRGIDTYVLPHVVERTSPSKEDTARMLRRLGLAGEPGRRKKPPVFYTVCDTGNARKNFPALLRAFARLPRGAARLVVKQYRNDLDLTALPDVTSVPEALSEGEMAALHALCDCYVSTHRGEAWGLGMSEALSHGNIVLATGWSGNMEYMNADNAVCLGYTLRPIRPEELWALPPAYEAGMRWADVDEDDLAARMTQVVQGRMDPMSGSRARESMRRFSRKNVANMLNALLHGLAARGKNHS